MIDYPYVFFDDDKNSMTYGEWYVKLNESTILDGYETEEKAYEDAQHHLTIERLSK